MPKSFDASLGSYQQAVDAALADLKMQDIIKRMWDHDYTVWKPEPAEIANRLGWLHCPENMVEQLAEINTLVDAVRADGYTQALLLGMGGSSLAPEVFRRTFGVKEGYLDLAVLDSTAPDTVLAQANRLDMSRTLFIVSTKSGGTVETFSFFKYFYNRVMDALGQEQAGRHFIAITDPGSGLVGTAKKYHFRATFLNDPDIGGRYSALSHFGIVPAALVGVDTANLLERARVMANSCKESGDLASANPGAWLGAIIGGLAAEGRNKVTLVASPPIAAFGTWVEQLIAESTGKEGKGILPVADEPLGPPPVYGNDRLFVYMRLEGDSTYDDGVQILANAGQPVVYLHLSDLYDMGAEFFRWEMAIPIAGRRIGINPFDQPNVEAAKALAREMVAEYQKSGKLPELTPTLQADRITVYADTAAGSLADAWNNFLAQGRPGDYIALQAYVQPTDETTRALQRLRTALRDRLHLATTVGYGPRFLHSTGQLHKGDAGNGLFIQFTCEDRQDAPIPDEAGSPQSSITFGVLIKAQALGDRQALLNARPPRRVIRFDLDKDIVGGLERLRALVR